MLFKELLVVYSFVFLLDTINCFGDDYGDYGPQYFSKGARVLTRKAKQGKQGKGVNKRAKYEMESTEYKRYRKAYVPGEDEGELIGSNSAKAKAGKSNEENSDTSNFGDDGATDKGGNEPPKDNPSDVHTNDQNESNDNSDHKSDDSQDKSDDHTSDESKDSKKAPDTGHASETGHGSDKDEEKQEGALKAIGRSAYEGLTRFGKGVVGVDADLTEDLEEKSHKRYGGKIKSYNAWTGNPRYERYPPRLYPRNRRHRYRRHRPFRTFGFELPRYHQDRYSGDDEDYPDYSEKDLAFQSHRNRPIRRRVNFFVSTNELNGKTPETDSSTSESHLNDDQSSEGQSIPELQSSDEHSEEHNEEHSDEPNTEHNEESNDEHNEEHTEEHNDEPNAEHNDESFLDLNLEPSDEQIEMDDNTIDGYKKHRQVVRAWHSSSSSQSKWDGRQMLTRQSGRKAGFGFDRDGDQTNSYEFDYSY